MPFSRRSLRHLIPVRRLAAGVLLGAFLAVPARAAVTITDCNSDPHCVVKNRQTWIDVPGDTVVIAGPITPLGDTSAIRVTARAIVVDAAGSLTASGKGRAIELVAASTALVNGPLIGTNPNGKITVTALDLVQLQGPVAFQSAGDLRFSCTGLGCQLRVQDAHFSANHLEIEAEGDVIWDRNTVATFGPHDLIEITAENGSITHAGGLSVAVLGNGRLAAAKTARTDATSEAVEGCVVCEPTPNITPTPTRTPTPTPPLMTATLPLSTPSLPLGTPTPGDPGPSPSPTVPPPCRNCGEGEGESNLIMRAAGDIDASGDKWLIANRIIMKAGLNIDVSHAELRNDFGKCGEIVLIAVGQVNIEGATLVDDNCPKAADVSELNDREQLPHQGFNEIVGTPALDD